MKILKEIIKRWFYYKPNKELIENMKKYEAKEKAKQ